MHGTSRNQEGTDCSMYCLVIADVIVGQRSVSGDYPLILVT